MASPDQMDWTATATEQPSIQQPVPPPGRQSGFRSVYSVPDNAIIYRPACPPPILPSQRPQPYASIYDDADYLTPSVTIRPVTARNRSLDPRFAGTSHYRPDVPLISNRLSGARIPISIPASSSRRVILQPVRPSLRISNRHHARQQRELRFNQAANGILSGSLGTQKSSTSIPRQILESPPVPPRKRVIEEIQETPAAEPEARRDVIQELLRFHQEESLMEVSGPCLVPSRLP